MIDAYPSLKANWSYPTAVRFGPGRIAELAEALKAAGIARPLFVTDPGLVDLPIVARALAVLAGAKVPVAVFSKVDGNPTLKNLEDGLAAYKAGGHDGVIVFGGGSAMDVGKLIAFISGQNRPVFDFEDREDWWTRADARGIARTPAEAFESLAGRGARASVEGRRVTVGGPRLLDDLGTRLPEVLAATTEAWASDGRTVLHVVADDVVMGALAIEDEVRPESAEAIERLHALGLRVAMITGDAQAVADSVARRLGIDEVAAQVLPEDKAAAVRRFQAGGRRVAMVGDGVNDAPALATADVGIAIGAGTDVAVESAGIVLVRSDPRDVVGAITLSRASYRKMIENLVWATGYNVVAIPVAAGVLMPWGIDMPMALGAVAMSASTIIVAANAQLLRRVRLGPGEDPPPTGTPAALPAA